MDQLRDFADDRLINGCIYCGGPADTRDHVPSKILLDKPYPENLPIVGACFSCNNGFSKDEEYLACLIESVIAGSTDPEKLSRASVANRLRRSPALRELIEQSKSVVDNQVHFTADPHRIRNVLLKLARGHAAFELSQPCPREPDNLRWCPLSTMSPEENDDFDAAHVVGLLGEVGSRGIQRMMVVQASLCSHTGEESVANLVMQDWVDVQEGLYRYLAIDDVGGVTIKIVIAEYLACEVSWAAEYA